MKGRSILILAVLLAWFAGMPVVRAGQIADHHVAMLQRTEQVRALPQAVFAQTFTCACQHIFHSATPKPVRNEKRHGKTLASPAIVVELPGTPPPFCYCTPDYPTFQAGAFAQWVFAAWFLRGPPSC